MKSLLRRIAVAMASVVIAAPLVRSQNPDLAKDLAEEGVTNEAKIEFVKVLHDPTKKSSYAEAQYYLGYLSFREKNYDRALKHWNILLKEYSGSPYTEKARDQIRIASLLLSRQQQLEGQDIQVNALFDNADFLIGEPLKVTIDTSYLSTGDLAIESLEEIVAKFPDSPDAPRALMREAMVYYGWGKQGIGEYSQPEGYGFVLNYYYRRNFKGGKELAQLYLNKIVEVSGRLDKQYPTSPFRIPVAFLAGQAYWGAAGGKTDANAKTYWNEVLSLTVGDTANTYRQVAQQRLK